MTPNQNTDLDRAISASTKRLTDCVDFYHRTVVIPESELMELVLAAKRLKEVEKERDNALVKSANMAARCLNVRDALNAYHTSKSQLDVENLEYVAEGCNQSDLLERFPEYHKVKEQQLSTLRTEYKKALEAIQPEHNKAWCLKEFGHLCSQHEVLSTPLAIETMKGEG